jgi:hypothetical protein
VAAFGPVREVTREYRRRVGAHVGAARSDLSTMDGPNRRERVFLGLRLLDESGQEVSAAPLGGPCAFEIEVDGRALPADAVLLVRIDDRSGQRFLTVRSPVQGLGAVGAPERLRVRCLLPYFPGTLGEYHVGLACRSRGEQIDEVERAIGLRIVGGDAFGEGWGAAAGLCVAPSQWSVEPAEDGGR